MNRLRTNKLKRLIEIGCIPSDTPEERLKKSIMTIMVIPYSLAAIIWGLYFMRNGFTIAGTIPLAYAVVSLTSFFYFVAYKTIQYIPLLSSISCSYFAFLFTVSTWRI